MWSTTSILVRRYKGAGVPQFEYKTQTANIPTDSLISELNTLGELGWEVYAVIATDSVLLLKREIPKWIPTPEHPSVAERYW